MTLAQLAEEALQNLRIEMQPMLPCNPPDWNVGELAVAHVRITNATGAPLREIAVRTVLFSSVAQYASLGDWDGNGALRPSLEPGEVWEDCEPALLLGLSAGSFQLGVVATAEVLPVGSSPFALAEYSVLRKPGSTRASGSSSSR